MVKRMTPPGSDLNDDSSHNFSQCTMDYIPDILMTNQSIAMAAHGNEHLDGIIEVVSGIQYRH